MSSSRNIQRTANVYIVKRTKEEFDKILNQLEKLKDINAKLVAEEMIKLNVIELPEKV